MDIILIFIHSFNYILQLFEWILDFNIILRVFSFSFLVTRRLIRLSTILLLTLQGEEIIVVIPWDEWWELALKDSSNPQIALLPLHPELRAKFNSTAAWEYARSMAGKPYGYHNMIFSWIDTVTDNYPPPLDAHLVYIFTDYNINMLY